MYASSLTKSNISACGTSNTVAITTGQYRRTTLISSGIEEGHIYHPRSPAGELALTRS
jgi:hypothetical protein